MALKMKSLLIVNIVNVSFLAKPPLPLCMLSTAPGNSIHLPTRHLHLDWFESLPEANKKDHTIGVASPEDEGFDCQFAGGKLYCVAAIKLAAGRCPPGICI